MNPDHEALGRHRAEAAGLIAKAIDHLERACVCTDSALTHVQRADLATDGPRLTLAAVIDVFKDQRDALMSEQHELVDAYADSLRRAEGQRSAWEGVDVDEALEALSKAALTPWPPREAA